MTEFKTPTSRKFRSRIENNSEHQTPIKIPASPFLKQIGYGCGVNVFTLERSPKVGLIRSPWAIKKRNTSVSKDKKYDERIRLEAKILRALQHPNIVGFRALTESEAGVPCLAMEQLDVSLGDMIEERVENGLPHFRAREIEGIGFEVAKGLEYLHHTAHILHGDLKSYNILVSKDLKIVKICDFGVSVPLTKTLELDKSTADFVYTGTECWNAPEVFSEGPITNKTDMWAYGLTLWEMIALSPPHVEIDESIDESMLDGSFLGSTEEGENDDPNGSFNDSLMILEEKIRAKYGTRPALPAIEIGPEYDKILEIFFICTDQDQKTRPSAKGVVSFFNNYILNCCKSTENPSTMDCDT
ncbi:lymphokine-activated killer T-cell-originated protein kinase homolog [Diachasma alloeum]|uniref:lymphokine-activated killer T-cell-originated protein kinase homolog n=1 Tax=Diachasma alloeum TaxID=454923 RepID=UPI000738386E|nr:lymphokine-activated killer T-cell-originated protein kinase homolog [Diachasma alloeum]